MKTLEKKITREQAALLFDVNEAPAAAYYLRLVPITADSTASCEFELFANDAEATDWADSMSFEWWDEV
jgi:hypothetical protein